MVRDEEKQLNTDVKAIADTDMPDQSRLFESSDLDYAKNKIEQIYSAYKYTAKKNSVENLPAVMYNLQGNSIGLSRFSYGTEIEIHPDPFKDFFLILTTVKGNSKIWTPDMEADGGIGNTVLIGPDDLSNYQYSDDNTQVVVKIPCAKIQEVSNKLYPMTSAVKIKSFSLDEACIGALWNSQVNYLRKVLDPNLDVKIRELLLPSAEESLIISLLSSQSDVLLRDCASREYSPASLRRAISFIDENHEHPITLAEIASAAHCGVRSLTRLFRNSSETSPMKYLKEVRLRNARAYLQSRSATDSVTSIALKCGFTHMGQFSADYKIAFGETPSQTFRSSE